MFPLSRTLLKKNLICFTINVGKILNFMSCISVIWQRNDDFFLLSGQLFSVRSHRFYVDCLPKGNNSYINITVVKTKNFNLDNIDFLIRVVGKVSVFKRMDSVRTWSLGKVPLTNNVRGIRNLDKRIAIRLPDMQGKEKTNLKPNRRGWKSDGTTRCFLPDTQFALFLKKIFP